MKFSERLEPSQELDQLRLVSDEGKWEFGIRSVMFGFRVSLFKAGNEWWTLDYCAADDQEFLLRLLVAMSTALDPVPETITERQLQDQFPRYEFKPIKYDRAWGEINELAYGVNPPSIECPVCERINYTIEAVICPCCRQAYNLQEKIS